MTDIVFESTVFPDAYWGIAYEAGIATKSSASVITNCVVATGALPPGLAIAADFVRITGTISGVGATLPKTYTFTLTSTDTAGGVTSGSYTITVREPQASTAVGGFTFMSPAAQQAASWPLKY